MSKINNGGLDQYGAGPFEHQQFETAGVERVKTIICKKYISTCNLDALKTGYLLVYLKHFIVQCL